MACLLCNAPEAQPMTVLGQPLEVCVACRPRVEEARAAGYDVLIGLIRRAMRKSAPLAFDVFSAAYQAFRAQQEHEQR